VSLSAGVRLGPYELTALIGEGGMGKVWRSAPHRAQAGRLAEGASDAFVSDGEWKATRVIWSADPGE
jgi:hypothetical protein